MVGLGRHLTTFLSRRGEHTKLGWTASSPGGRRGGGVGFASWVCLLACRQGVPLSILRQAGGAMEEGTMAGCGWAVDLRPRARTRHVSGNLVGQNARHCCRGRCVCGSDPASERRDPPTAQSSGALIVLRGRRAGRRSLAGKAQEVSLIFAWVELPCDR